MAQHHFDIGLAKEYGVDLAIFVNNIDFWLKKNYTDKTANFEERVWTTITTEQMTKYFPYWSERRVRTVLSNAVEKEIIEKGHFGGTDRTTSYTFSDTFIFKHTTALGLWEVGYRNEISTNDKVEVKAVKPIKKVAEEDNQYLELIDYWNSKEYLTKHKLPNESGECSQTIFQTIKMLREVLEGRFYSKNKFSNYPNLIYDSVITVEDIKSGVDALNESFKPTNAPTNKKVLPKSFKDYLCNMRTFKSSFLMFLSDSTPKEQEIVSQTVIDMYMKVLGKIDKSWEITLVSKLSKLKEVFKRNKYLCDFVPKYDTYMGTEISFYTTHIDYLKTYSELTVGHCNTYGKVWERFMAWLQDTHGLKLDLNENEIYLMKKRKELGVTKSQNVLPNEFTLEDLE